MRIELGDHQLYQGWGKDVLPLLAENSVDSIVTDPPYGLSKEPNMVEVLTHWLAGDDYTHSGNGFMGKSWDSFVPGPATWREIFRVLKPGGYALVFAGSRTVDLMGVSLRLAGFEIRDQIQWVYGCLSDDTEILINGRWEHYHKAIVGSLALCYDVEHETYQWQPIQDFIEYDYCDTAYRVQSDSTDQIVSRNHRCLVERDGKLVFQYAETLERQEIVPVLESVSELLDSIPLSHERTGGPKSVLWGVQAGAGSTETSNPCGDGDRVHGMQESGTETECLAQKNQETNLLPTMQREIARGSANDQPIRQDRNDVSWDRNERRKEPCLERRCDVLSETRELQVDKVRSMSDRLSTDGSERRVCDGTPVDRCAGNRSVPYSDRSGTSCGSQPAKQRCDELGTVREQPSPQIVRGSGVTSTTVARVEPFHYVGKVWCVRVPTGAFVARRNGKVFITGNSGFPKSLDISKALDKAAGVEREEGTPGPYSARRPRADVKATNAYADGVGEYGSSLLTVPVTPEAQQWQGWGTALKPAHEPIIVCRKPLIGAVAQNILTHGVGGLNIDGCRVGTGEDTGRKVGGNPREGWGMHGNDYSTIGSPLGRFPANVCHDGSDEVRAAFPDAGGQQGVVRGTEQSNTGGDGTNCYGEYGRVAYPSPRVELDKSAARFFYCAKASKSDRGEHNNHPTVKPQALMRYLVRLVTPPGGIILDSFAGSGSTGVAAHAEGFRSILVEQCPDNFNTCCGRVAMAVMTETPV